jgi:hypothetical protein
MDGPGPVVVVGALYLNSGYGLCRGGPNRLGSLAAEPRDAPVIMAFFDELRRRGFIEGQNLTVEYRVMGNMSI